MADKSISDLTQATQITGSDLFVLEQSGIAKKLLGSALLQYISHAAINSIESVSFDAQGRCTVTLSDGTTITSASLKGQDGTDGVDGTNGIDGTDGADAPTITNISINASYHLIVTLSNGTSYDAGYCRGASGAGTGDMLASDYDPGNTVKTAGGIIAYINSLDASEVSY